MRLTNWPSIAVFSLAGLAMVVFAFASVNLFTSAMASASFIGEHGLEAIRHGALWQVLELVFSGSVALAMWVSFKICEHILVDRYLAWSHASEGGLLRRRQKER